MRCYRVDFLSKPQQRVRPHTPQYSVEQSQEEVRELLGKGAINEVQACGKDAEHPLPVLRGTSSPDTDELMWWDTHMINWNGKSLLKKEVVLGSLLQSYTMIVWSHCNELAFGTAHTAMFCVNELCRNHPHGTLGAYIT